MVESNSKNEVKEEKKKAITAEGVAAAASLAAISAVVPEIMKDPTARWMACAAIGLGAGIYGANQAVKYAKGEKTC